MRAHRVAATPATGLSRRRMNALHAINQRGEGQGSTGVRVPWWSFTKTVIAAACLRAAGDGLLSLDEPLPAGGYTLRRLLRHEARTKVGTLTTFRWRAGVGGTARQSAEQRMRIPQEKRVFIPRIAPAGRRH